MRANVFFHLGNKSVIILLLATLGCSFQSKELNRYPSSFSDNSNCYTFAQSLFRKAKIYEDGPIEDVAARLRNKALDDISSTSDLNQRAKENYSVLGKPASFSFEVELELANNPGLLNYYRPYRYSDDEWMALPIGERMGIVEKLIDQKVNLPAVSKKIMARMDHAPEFIAKDLIVAEGRRVEIADNLITGNMKQMFEGIDWVWEHLGIGSLQGHVAFDKGNPFVDRAIYHIKFDHDIAINEALAAGYQKHQSSPEFIPGANFENPFLAPGDHKTFRITEEKLYAHRYGEGGEAKNLRSKFFYGIAFRQDLYGKQNIGFEVRNCHKRLACLKEKLLELAEQTERNFEDYGSYDNLGPTLGRDLLSQLTFSERFWLKNVGQTIGGVFEIASDKPSRLLFPLMDWKSHPLIKNLSDEEANRLLPILESESAKYLQKLREIKDSGVSRKEAKKQLRIAMAEWAHETNIHVYLRSGKKNSIPKDDLDRHFYAGAIEPRAGPLADSFPEQMLEGPIRMRMEKLQKKWPKNVRMVRDVVFEMDTEHPIFGAGTKKRKRDMLVVTTSGLDESEKEILKKDYLAATSANMITFKGSGHLYTRMGNKVYDWQTQLRRADFSQGRNDSLETFFILRPSEQFRLRRFLDNVMKNSEETVGEFEMDGPVLQSPIRTTGWNVPFSGGHNCTSYICTAPIGVGMTTLSGMAGAAPGLNVSRNPKRWIYWLNIWASRSRSPMSAIFSDNPLSSILERVQTGEVYQPR